MWSFHIPSPPKYHVHVESHKDLFTLFDDFDNQLKSTFRFNSYLFDFSFKCVTKKQKIFVVNNSYSKIKHNIEIFFTETL